MKPLKRWRWWRLNRRRGRLALDANPLACTLPPPGMPIGQAPLLAIDLEMTGLAPQSDHIITIGWVAVDAGRIRLDQAGEVAISGMDGPSVGHSATIHGIRDCDRSHGLPLRQALLALLSALGGRIAVFHHAPLDLAFLGRALERELGFGWPAPTLDTLEWHRRRRLRREGELSGVATALDAVRQYHGLPVRTGHSALADALSCAEIALILAERSRATLEDACRVPRLRRTRPSQQSSRRSSLQTSKRSG